MYLFGKMGKCAQKLLIHYGSYFLAHEVSNRSSTFKAQGQYLVTERFPSPICLQTRIHFSVMLHLFCLHIIWLWAWIPSCSTNGSILEWTLNRTNTGSVSPCRNDAPRLQSVVRFAAARVRFGKQNCDFCSERTEGRGRRWWNAGAGDGGTAEQRLRRVLDSLKVCSPETFFYSTVNSLGVNLRTCHPPLLMSNGRTHTPQPLWCSF